MEIELQASGDWNINPLMSLELLYMAWRELYRCCLLVLTDIELILNSSS